MLLIITPVAKVNNRVSRMYYFTRSPRPSKNWIVIVDRTKCRDNNTRDPRNLFNWAVKCKKPLIIVVYKAKRSSRMPQKITILKMMYECLQSCLPEFRGMKSLLGNTGDKISDVPGEINPHKKDWLNWRSYMKTAEGR